MESGNFIFLLQIRVHKVILRIIGTNRMATRNSPLCAKARAYLVIHLDGNSGKTFSNSARGARSILFLM